MDMVSYKIVWYRTPSMTYKERLEILRDKIILRIHGNILDILDIIYTFRNDITCIDIYFARSTGSRYIRISCGIDIIYKILEYMKHEGYLLVDDKKWKEICKWISSIMMS